MIEELVKEKRKQRDQEETQKIMNAIHEQAYWKRVEKENKEMFKKMEQQIPKKPTKKEQLQDLGLNVVLGLNMIATIGLLLFIMSFH